MLLEFMYCPIMLDRGSGISFAGFEFMSAFQASKFYLIHADASGGGSNQYISRYHTSGNGFPCAESSLIHMYLCGMAFGASYWFVTHNLII